MEEMEFRFFKIARGITQPEMLFIPAKAIENSTNSLPYQAYMESWLSLGKIFSE
jgi:hypothetical protein